MGDSIEEGFYQDHFVLFDDAFTEALHRWAPKKTFVFYFSSNQTQQLAVRPAGLLQITAFGSCSAFRLNNMGLRSDLTCLIRNTHACSHVLAVILQSLIDGIAIHDSLEKMVQGMDGAICTALLHEREA